METQVDEDKVEPHNLEDKVLVFIRNNTSGAAPMDMGNTALGQAPTPGLGSSNQSTTSSSHGGSDSYPDLNNYEYAAQWDKIGTLVMPTHQEVQMVSCTVCRKTKGRAKVEVSTASATTCGKSGYLDNFCYATGGKAKGKGKKGDSKGWNDRKGWTVGKGMVR